MLYKDYIDFEKFVFEKIEKKKAKNVEYKTLVELEDEIERLRKQDSNAYRISTSDSDRFSYYSNYIPTEESRRFKIKNHSEAEAFLTATEKKFGILKSNAQYSCSKITRRKFAKLVEKRSYCERQLKIRDDLQAANDRYNSMGGRNRKLELLAEITRKIIVKNADVPAVSKAIVASIASGGNLATSAMKEVSSRYWGTERHDAFEVAVETVDREVVKALKKTIYKPAIDEVKAEISKTAKSTPTLLGSKSAPNEEQEDEIDNRQ